MSIKLEAIKFGLRTAREKLVKDIKKRCIICGQEFSVPRSGAKSVQTYLYYPDTPVENMPILVNIHGGAWVGCDALLLDTQSGMYADALGCLVVNVNYTKADVEPLPCCQEQARDVIEYFIDHASEFGADGTRIAVIGYSAGAQISAAAAQMCYDDSYSLNAQILCYPFLDFTCDGGKQTELAASLGSMNDFGKLFFEKISKTDPRVSPALRKELSGLPRAIIVQCGKDGLGVQAKQYHDLLTAAGVPSEILFYPEAYHGFLEVNYPETTQEQESRSPEQAEMMRHCEREIIARLEEIWR